MKGPFVMIRHVSTEYVPAQSEVEGVIANKVNVLTFELQMKDGSDRKSVHGSWL